MLICGLILRGYHGIGKPFHGPRPCLFAEGSGFALGEYPLDAVGKFLGIKGWGELVTP